MVERIFAGAGLILLPFIFEIGAPDEMRLPKAKALLLMAMLYGCAKLFQRVDRALSLFALVVSVSAWNSSTGIPYQDLAIFWAAISTSFWIKEMNERDLLAGLRIFECTALLAALYSAIQISGHDPFIEYYSWAESWRPSVLFGQHTLYGPWAVTGFLIALFRRHYIVAAILLFPILIINSSFTFLSLAGGLFLWVWFTHKKWLSHIMALSLLIGVLGAAKYPDKISEALDDKGRLSLWSQTIFLAERRPILGYGFGSFKEIYPQFQVPQLRHANGLKDAELTEKTRAFIKQAEYLKALSGVFLSSHNDLLQHFFECGILGVLSVLLMALHFFLRARRLFWWPAFPLLFTLAVAFSLNSLGNFPFHLIPQALIPLWCYVFIVTRKPIADTMR